MILSRSLKVTVTHRAEPNCYLLLSLCKKVSNHHANLPLEMYSFTLYPPGKHLETTGADDLTL